MNGKKAKLLRKYGKVEKKAKKVYNSLTHSERGLMKEVVEFNIARKKTIE
jgi:hypothetical protein|tara:strand:- start:966 stop:1115 length:150 start_codon:yes stop_codon:yes gene_type:complete